jgi:hypothetical protein
MCLRYTSGSCRVDRSINITLYFLLQQMRFPGSLVARTVPTTSVASRPSQVGLLPIQSNPNLQTTASPWTCNQQGHHKPSSFTQKPVCLLGDHCRPSLPLELPHPLDEEHCLTTSFVLIRARECQLHSEDCKGQQAGSNNSHTCSDHGQFVSPTSGFLSRLEAQG